MATQTDLALLQRLDHVIVALDVAATEATSTSAFVDALGEARGRCEQSRQTLNEAIRAVDDDAGENAVAAATLAATSTRALDEYRWLRSESERALRRRQRVGDLDAAAAAQANSFMARHFSASPSDLERGGVAARLEALRKAGEGLEAGALPLTLPEQDVAAFQEALAAFAQAHAESVAEGLDDGPLLAALQRARGGASATLVATRALIDSVLRFEDSALDVDDFILRARRRSSASAPVASAPTTATLLPTPELTSEPTSTTPPSTP